MPGYGLKEGLSHLVRRPVLISYLLYVGYTSLVGILVFGVCFGLRPTASYITTTPVWVKTLIAATCEFAVLFVWYVLSVATLRAVSAIPLMRPDRSSAQKEGLWVGRPLGFYLVLVAWPVVYGLSWIIACLLSGGLLAGLERCTFAKGGWTGLILSRLVDLAENYGSVIGGIWSIVLFAAIWIGTRRQEGYCDRWSPWAVGGAITYIVSTTMYGLLLRAWVGLIRMLLGPEAALSYCRAMAPWPLDLGKTICNLMRYIAGN